MFHSTCPIFTLTHLMLIVCMSVHTYVVHHVVCTLFGFQYIITCLGDCVPIMKCSKHLEVPDVLLSVFEQQIAGYINTVGINCVNKYLLGDFRNFLTNCVRKLKQIYGYTPTFIYSLMIEILSRFGCCFFDVVI